MSDYGFRDVVLNDNCHGNFTMLPNDIIRHSQLTGVAFKLLAVLLSNKKGWKSYARAMEKYMCEKRIAISSGLAQLEKFGYLCRLQYRHNDTKTFAGTRWVISIIPWDFELDEAIAEIENAGFTVFFKDSKDPRAVITQPDIGSPDIGSHATNNNNINKNKNKLPSSPMTRNKPKYKKIANPVKHEQPPNLVKYIVPSQFDDFWNLYPYRKGRSIPKTKKAWKKACNLPKSERPTWRTVKKAILRQIKSEQWQVPQRIALPSTWLNRGDWDADPKEMIDWDKERNSSSSKSKPRGSFKGKISNPVDPKDILLEGIVSKQSMDIPYLWHSQVPSLLNQAAKLCSCDKASKLKLAKNFNTMYHDILDERSPNGKHFKNPQTIIERYIDWLSDGGGTWVKDPKPHIFDITSTIFKNYFLPWLMTDNLDFNPITGKMDDTGCPYASR